MTLRIAEVPGDQLPENTTHGFRVWDEWDDVLMFFHWHEQPVENQLLYDEDGPTQEIQRTTSYTDVLKALPDRLAAMGYEDESPYIIGKVVDMFGAGT